MATISVAATCKQVLYFLADSWSLKLIWKLLRVFFVLLFCERFNSTNQFNKPRHHNSLFHYNNAGEKTRTFQCLYFIFFSSNFFSSFLLRFFVNAEREKNWLAIFKNVRNVSNNRVNLFYIFFIFRRKKFFSFLLVIYRELRLRGKKEWMKECRGENTKPKWQVNGHQK